MRPSRFLGLILTVALAVAQVASSVGGGAPNEASRLAFQFAFTRGSFSSRVSLPPTGNVRRFGPTGLVQEFPDAVNGSDPQYRHALVRPSSSETASGLTAEVWQVNAPLWDFYSTTGPATAGYPNTDSQPCSTQIATGCLYQTFDKNYALFSYSNGTNFALLDPFYTKWVAAGAVGGLGSGLAQEDGVTSAAGGAKADLVTFTQGAIYNHTSGNFSGKIFGVRQPAYATYLGANNAHLGFLGFPISDELIMPNGRRRQNFEGGSIEWELGQEPIVRLPVSTITVSTSLNAQRLNLGDMVSATASLFAANGAALSDRPVTWTTSNVRVVSIEPTSGVTVKLRATGGGSASITAISEGRASRPVTIFVVAPCCQIGEGAPTPAIAQAFQDAVTRNRLNVKLPASNPVRRVGIGFVQEFADSANPSIRYVLAKPDAFAAAFLLTGAILNRYLDLGGPAGLLGYPVADPVNGPRQLFEGGALAGSPVQLVTVPILTRWAATNYELGIAGLPVGVPANELSFTATAGLQQPFANGSFIAGLTGALVNRVYFVGGPILAKYSALGGVSGALGLPVSEEVAIGGRRRQEFEGGTLEHNPATGETAVAEKNRQPQISATPSTVAAGGRVRIAAGGFPAGSTLRVSMSGNPDFVVETASGAYAWEYAVPRGAVNGLVTLSAAQVNGSAIAAGSFVIQAASETQYQVSKLRGDQQTGMPGARLPQPLRILVRDEFGNPAPGIAVRFNPSPGAGIEDAETITNSRGEAQAWLRVPAAEGVALATAEAGRQVVTFSARSAAATFNNFPRFTQAGSNTPVGGGPGTMAQQGAMLVAAASVVRHLQNTNEVPQSGGPADPEVLNSFLKDFCVFDLQGAQICDGFVLLPESPEKIVNLWRLVNFTGGNLDVVPVEARSEAIRDALAQGSPLLIALSMTANGAPAGSHFVAAIGIAQNGGILVHDPNPRFGRGSLDEFLSGFNAVDGRAWKASIAAVVRLAPRTASAFGFLLTAGNAEPALAGPSGRCAAAFSWPNLAASGGELPAAAPGTARFTYCDGADAVYQLDLAAGARATVTDLANPGSRTDVTASSASVFRIARPASNWTVSPQELGFAAASVVNAASFRAELAPGILASIFGSGLVGAGAPTTATVDGRPATVLFASPFQVNAVLPADLAPGAHTLTVGSAYGTSAQTIELREVAPAIFFVDGGLPAVLNQDGSLNSPERPARRGQVISVYGTGFGATREASGLQVVVNAIEATLLGQPVRVDFAGLAPGFPGLYQINLMIPAGAPPGLSQPLLLRQAGTETQAVIAVQ